MWFFFGLVTLIGSAVLMYRHRREDRWVGQSDGRLQFEERKNPKTGKVVMLWVRIDMDPALDFEIKRERWYDRLAKRLGVSDEAQVGRRQFDETCYVVTDDLAVRARLRVDAAMTEGLRELAEYDAAGYRFHRLTCRNGRLRVDFKPAGKVPALAPTLAWLRPRMQALSDNAKPSLLRKPIRDPYFLRSMLVLAASAGLAISGAVQLLRLAFQHLPFTVDRAQLWTLTLPVATLLLFALVAATVMLLARTSRAHLVLMEVLLVGSFGALSTAYTELRDFNIEADRSEAVLLPSIVANKYERRGRRGSRSYYLVLTDWNGGGGTRKVQVSSGTYRSFNAGQMVSVRQHAGALRVRWVEAFEPMAMPAPR